MNNLIKENDMGCFVFISDEVFDDFGQYFLKRIEKDDNFKLYRYNASCGSPNDKYPLELDKLHLVCNGVQNDIFEGLPYGDYDIYSQEECINNLEKLAYLKCFTETSTNNLMWAHYANNYKGICIEYDICKLNDKKIKKNIFPVHYMKKRNVFDAVEYLVEYMKGEHIVDCLADSKGLFIAKADHWKYEKEWRLCYMNCERTNKENKKIPFACVSAIYMGPRIEKENIQCLQKLIKAYEEKYGCSVELYKMKLASDNSYNLEYEKYEMSEKDFGR